MLTDFFGLLDAATPMLFAAIAVAIAFKAGLFNIGISGQMLAGGFVATVLVGYSDLSAFVARPLVLLIGATVGALLAVFAGWLKARFNIHEVVSTIMINYIISHITGFLIKKYFVHPITRQSISVSASARLTLVNVSVGDISTRIPLCFLLAVAMAVVFYVLIHRTRLGFEIRSVGSNRRSAEYSGISIRKTTIISMLLSGVAAGLAGVTCYLGYFDSIIPGDLSVIGFDSIAVAMLAGSNPLACIAASLFLTTFSYGSVYMSSQADISQHIASLLIGIVLLFSACSGYFSSLLTRRFGYQPDHEDTAWDHVQAEPEENLNHDHADTEPEEDRI
jgi:simple sugar transport system permease protein